MQSLRVVTLNLWGEQPPLDRRMAGITAELTRLRADVIGLQEVRQIPGVLENQAVTLATTLGMHQVFGPATRWGNGDEGVAILSRHPILSHQTRELPDSSPEERRVVLTAVIDHPAGKLAAATTHLTYRLHDGLKRERQVLAAEAAVAAVPSELPRLFMGDFNASPDADEIRYLRGLHTLGSQRVFWQDAWDIRHPDQPGYTWALANPHTERLAWLTRERRLDYIFVGPERRDGSGRVHEVALCCTTADETGCLPSDHYGLCADLHLADKV